MVMYNLLYYSKIIKWNYYPDKPSSGYIGDNENTRVYYPTVNSESFDYKTKIVGELPDGNNVVLPNIKIIVPLKNLSNFNLNFLMINTEIELILKWSQNCVLTERARRNGKQLVAVVKTIDTPSDLKFNITDCTLYVPVVTLQEKYENELYKNLKTGTDIDFEWGRYRTQIINQPATNNLNFLIDPTFNNVNRLFVLAFPNEEGRSSFSSSYTPSVNRFTTFYDIPIKNKEQTYKAITELINHDNYTTGNSFTYEYFCNHYKLIAIDLSKQNSDLKINK